MHIVLRSTGSLSKGWFVRLVVRNYFSLGVICTCPPEVSPRSIPDTVPGTRTAYPPRPRPSSTPRPLRTCMPTRRAPSRTPPRPALAAAATTLALALAAGLMPNIAAAPHTEGPYAGILLSGQSATHHYDNHPYPEPCPLYFAPVPWLIQLDYGPPTASVTLDVGDHGTATGSNGLATLRWEGDGCEILTLTVTAHPNPTGTPGAIAYVLNVHPHASQDAPAS